MRCRSRNSVPYWVLPVVLGALGLCNSGCAKSAGTEAALALNEGVTALESGRYREAMAACIQAATLEQQNRSARMCWLAAAISQGDWHSAGEALAAARLIWPDDEWLRAVAVEISYRLTGQAQEMPVTSQTMAWACATGACLSAPLGEAGVEGSSLTASALVRMKEGLWDEAAALLEPACKEEGDCTDLLLMAWVKLNHFDRVAEWLRKRPCEGATVLASGLRSFLLPAEEGCPGSSVAGSAEWESSEATRMMERAMLLSAGQSDRLSVLESVCALEPGWAIPQLLAGMELLLRGETKRARVYLDRASEVAQERGWPWVLLSVSELLASGRLGRSYELAVSEGMLPGGWSQWLESLVR